MWKSIAAPEAADSAVKPAAASAPAPRAPEPGSSLALARASVTGAGITIRGEITASEDLVIDGEIEGSIALGASALTIGPSGRVRANISARRVTILGTVTGDVVAAEVVVIKDGGSLEGRIQAPRVSLDEGAFFRGSIDMNAAAGADGGQRPAAQPLRVAHELAAVAV